MYDYDDILLFWSNVFRIASNFATVAVIHNLQ